MTASPKYHESIASSAYCQNRSVLDMFLYTFDLIELNGKDIRSDPLDMRTTKLASLLARTPPGIDHKGLAGLSHDR
jgi:ATP-dependent DNA ligase